MKQLINVKANLFVTPNQLGWNNNCYDEVRRNSCYDKSGRNSCNDEAGLNSCFNKTGRNNYYDEAGRIGIFLRILTPEATESDTPMEIGFVVWHNISFTEFKDTTCQETR